MIPVRDTITRVTNCSSLEQGHYHGFYFYLHVNASTSMSATASRGQSRSVPSGRHGHLADGSDSVTVKAPGCPRPFRDQLLGDPADEDNRDADTVLAAFRILQPAHKDQVAPVV